LGRWVHIGYDLQPGEEKGKQHILEGKKVQKGTQARKVGFDQICATMIADGDF